MNSESEATEESPCGRWQKQPDKIISPNVHGVANAYLAVDNEEGIEVVWNEIHFSTNNHESSEEKCTKDKLTAFAKFDHPNLIKLKKFWTDNKGDHHRLVFITEHISSSMKSYLKKTLRQVRPLAVWRRWSHQILSALAFLHSQQPLIAHGNLTCDTIFIQNSGLLKLSPVSLGLTDSHGRANENLDFFKHLHFFAPELFVESPSLAAESDLAYPPHMHLAPQCAQASFQNCNSMQTQLQANSQSSSNGNSNNNQNSNGNSRQIPLPNHIPIIHAPVHRQALSTVSEASSEDVLISPLKSSDLRPLTPSPGYLRPSHPELRGRPSDSSLLSPSSLPDENLSVSFELNSPACHDLSSTSLNSLGTSSPMTDIRDSPTQRVSNTSDSTLHNCQAHSLSRIAVETRQNERSPIPKFSHGKSSDSDVFLASGGLEIGSSNPYQLLNSTNESGSPIGTASGNGNGTGSTSQSNQSSQSASSLSTVPSTNASHAQITQVSGESDVNYNHISPVPSESHPQSLPTPSPSSNFAARESKDRDEMSASSSVTLLGEFTPASDVYAFGVCALEMAAFDPSQVAIIATDIIQNLRNVLQSEIDAGSNVAEQCSVQCAIIDQCLKWQPHERPSAAHLLANSVLADGSGGTGVLQGGVHHSEDGSSLPSAPADMPQPGQPHAQSIDNHGHTRDGGKRSDSAISLTANVANVNPKAISSTGPVPVVTSSEPSLVANMTGSTIDHGTALDVHAQAALNNVVPPLVSPSKALAPNLQPPSSAVALSELGTVHLIQEPHAAHVENAGSMQVVAASVQQAGPSTNLIICPVSSNAVSLAPILAHSQFLPPPSAASSMPILTTVVTPDEELGPVLPIEAIERCLLEPVPAPEVNSARFHLTIDLQMSQSSIRRNSSFQNPSLTALANPGSQGSDAKQSSQRRKRSVSTEINLHLDHPRTLASELVNAGLICETDRDYVAEEIKSAWSRVAAIPQTPDSAPSDTH